MKTRKIVSILIIASVAVLMLTVAVASAEPVSAASKVKVTWNANGGKIGTAKITTSTVTKDVKIGKLPKTPKKVNYSFKGWYTKKTGGTKVTTNTKVKKKVTYYAQWKKTSSSTNVDSKLLGTWSCSAGGYDSYIQVYYKNGTFRHIYFWGTTGSVTEGKYKVSNGKIYFTNIVYEPGGMYEKRFKDTVFGYKFGKDNIGEYLLISPHISGSEGSYVDSSKGVNFRK
ncbi:MAG: InlB B-repeat-containing protein [Methanobrevibacter sp.]|nr:InlB B-repeat-containing protein [Methanobrevibacter sp.]